MRSATTLALLSVFLGACSRSEPEKVAKLYREAKRWEDRIGYVKNPEIVRPLMGKYYSQSATVFPQPYIEIEKPEKTNVPIGEWIVIKVILSRGNNSFGMTVTEAAFYDIQHTEKGYKIDWESSIPYNPMTAAEFNSTKSANPVRFRAVAELSDVYPFMGSYEFRQKYWSISLFLERRATTGNVESLGIGFISKETNDGKALYELLRNGGRRNVTIDASFTKVPSDSAYFRIDKFVCPDWHRPE